MAPHIKSGFEGGAKWGFAKAQRPHGGAQHKGAKMRLCAKFKQGWGSMAQFDNQGKSMSLVLNTEPG